VHAITGGGEQRRRPVARKETECGAKSVQSRAEGNSDGDQSHARKLSAERSQFNHGRRRTCSDGGKLHARTLSAERSPFTDDRGSDGDQLHARALSAERSQFTDDRGSDGDQLHAPGGH
jgi:hypothetical protein